jgi:NADP-dependent 3-hydroxy acid dehydrogenase YdfG
MTTLSGKVALFTGGTSGIGKASAFAKLNEVIALAQAGVKVVVAGRWQAEGEETIRQIQAIGWVRLVRPKKW